MKHRIIKFLPIAFLVTGCSFKLPFDRVESSIDVSNKTGLTYQALRNYLGFKDLPSVGETKLLVIPVVFNDCTLTSSQLENEHDRIEKTFFGKSEDTYWESVSSFYNKSSYGKLNITGKVSDYFYFDKTIIDANKIYINENKEPTLSILNSAVDWYKSFNDDIKDYDINNDGYIDSVYLAYMEDYNSIYFSKNPSYSRIEHLSDFLWAYTFWNQRSIPNVNSPTSFSYSWASYKFTYEGSSSKADAHTFIHETGHLLGLDDYYNYDYSLSIKGDRTRPIGGLDMMDLNILDHNAYTKYLLNWIEPQVIGTSGTYNLNSFQETGDAIIIPASSWNGSPLDEFLILELYTPIGLNKLDTNTSYCGNYPKGFSKNGVKIYHVDSRLGKYNVINSGTIEFVDYINSPNDIYSVSKKYYVDIVNSNTPSRSDVTNNKLLTLISSTGTNNYYSSRNGGVANNNDLFKDGSYLNTFSFNQYDDNNLLIEIDNMSSSSCSVRISGIGK